MKALILGGESPRHYEWVRSVAEALEPHSERVVYLDYAHWPGRGPTDIAHEVNEVAQLAHGLTDYVVVAKSIGTVIATIAMAKGTIHPVRCVFFGLPIRVFERDVDSVSFAALPETTIVQNEHDPVASSEDVEAYLRTVPLKTYTLKITQGNTHDYADFALIASLASKA